MNTCVVDASLAVKWYVPEVHADKAQLMLDGTRQLCAPELILPEFGNIIWKKVRLGEFDQARGRNIVQSFLAVPLEKYPGAILLEPAYELAVKTKQTVYDCIYLALAVALDCQFATADEKFYGVLATTKLANHLLWVENIS